MNFNGLVPLYICSPYTQHIASVSSRPSLHSHTPSSYPSMLSVRVLPESAVLSMHGVIRWRFVFVSIGRAGAGAAQGNFGPLILWLLLVFFSCPPLTVVSSRGPLAAYEAFLGGCVRDGLGERGLRGGVGWVVIRLNSCVSVLLMLLFDTPLS